MCTGPDKKCALYSVKAAPSFASCPKAVQWVGGGGLLAGSALWDFEEGGLFRDDTTTFGGWWLDLFQEEYDHKDSNKMTPGRFAASTDSQILTSE